MPPLKRKKIVLKPRAVSNGDNGLQEEATTNHQPVVEEKASATNTDMQQFVMLLKRKLEKADLKALIQEIKVYKNEGTIQPLINLLKEYCVKNVISKHFLFLVRRIAHWDKYF